MADKFSKKTRSTLLRSFAFVEQDPSILSLCMLEDVLHSAQASPEICAFVVAKILIPAEDHPASRSMYTHLLILPKSLLQAPDPLIPL
jgi:hypothetical protein